MTVVAEKKGLVAVALSRQVVKPGDTVYLPATVIEVYPGDQELKAHALVRRPGLSTRAFIQHLVSIDEAIIFKDSGIST